MWGGGCDGGPGTSLNGAAPAEDGPVWEEGLFFGGRCSRIRPNRGWSDADKGWERGGLEDGGGGAESGAANESLGRRESSGSRESGGAPLCGGGCEPHARLRRPREEDLLVATGGGGIESPHTRPRKERPSASSGGLRLDRRGGPEDGGTEDGPALDGGPSREPVSANHAFQREARRRAASLSAGSAAASAIIA